MGQQEEVYEEEPDEVEDSEESATKDGEVGNFKDAFMELHEGEKNLACSACNHAVKKMVENAKKNLRQNPTKKSLSTLKDECAFKGFAKTNGKYENFDKLMKSGGGSFSGLSMTPEIDENLGKSCTSIVEKYTGYIWKTFESRKKKMSGWSGYKLSKEICQDLEMICPQKSKRKKKSEL